MNHHRENGQAILELAFAVPILLIVLLGAYASVRTAFLISRAESAAFTETLRAGRNLPEIDRDLSQSVLQDNRSIHIRNGREGDVRLLPPPLPSFAGRSSATVNLRKEWEELGNPAWLPAAHIERKTELGVDCWGKDTSSGKKAERWIRAAVLLGATR